MHREAFMATARASQAVCADFAFGAVLARTAAFTVVFHVANMIYRRMPPVVDRIHLVEALILARAVTVYADIEVLREQLLATIAVHVALGYLGAAAFATHVAMAPRVDAGLVRGLPCIRPRGDGHLPLLIAVRLHLLGVLVGLLVTIDNVR